MLKNTSQIRKAAVLIRSLDADTAASLLAQLTPDEAHAVRAAIRSLGSVDPDEQADVVAEFRHVAPLSTEKTSDGVELRLTSAASGQPSLHSATPDGCGRFQFLEDAPTDTIVRCLSREHVQTIAVVLSHMRPARAAQVLAALPARLQADTIERLAGLGDTDPDSVTVLERELSTWLAGQSGRSSRARRTDAVAAILAASSQPARNGMLNNLKNRNTKLAQEISRLLPEEPSKRELKSASETPLTFDRYPIPAPETHPWVAARRELPQEPSTPPLCFDDLARLSAGELAVLLREVDADVLVLALAGSSDEMVELVAGRMPRKLAKAFRHQLRRLGPTRLSDVENAQAAVATAARSLHSRRYLRKLAA